MTKVAILVDGGFYRKVSNACKGHRNPEEKADELINYCLRHLKRKHDDGYDELYRIFYYDCPPIEKVVYHPLTKENMDFSKSDTKKWSEEFFDELAKRRKVALRFGELSDGSVNFNLNPGATRKLLSGKLRIENLNEHDFTLNVKQKGVDMKIGLDIASLAFKKQVDKIVLIAGDSDFVPAAKLARREGIDFVLDPLGNKIKSSLSLHIDGIQTCDKDYWNQHDS
ncbi:NYN domain-containing protein [Lactovum odontotermitis]